MEKAFILEFVFEEETNFDGECVADRHVLPISGPLVDDISEGGCGNQSLFETWAEDLYDKGIIDGIESEYGVHDYSTADNQHYIEVMGFSTYEVTRDKVEELMAKWRQVFVDGGFTVGEKRIENIQ